MRSLRNLAVLLASATVGHAAFRAGCANAPWDSSTDFFLDKYDADDPTIPMFPQYNNTFVRIRNRQRREVVLHCTNEPPPRSVVGDSALIVKVPVQSVGALDGFSQNLIEVRRLQTNVPVVYHTVLKANLYSDPGEIRDHSTYGRILRRDQLLRTRQHDEQHHL